MSGQGGGFVMVCWHKLWLLLPIFLFVFFRDKGKVRMTVSQWCILNIDNCHCWLNLLIVSVCRGESKENIGRGGGHLLSPHPEKFKTSLGYTVKFCIIKRELERERKRELRTILHWAKLKDWAFPNSQKVGYHLWKSPFYLPWDMCITDINKTRRHLMSAAFLLSYVEECLVHNLSA